MLQLSTAIRAAAANQIDGTIGASAQLVIYTGSAPANPAASATGTVLVTMALPSTWLTSPGTGVKALSGTWSGTATGTGTAGYFPDLGQRDRELRHPGLGHIDRRRRRPDDQQHVHRDEPDDQRDVVHADRSERIRY